MMSFSMIVISGNLITKKCPILSSLLSCPNGIEYTEAAVLIIITKDEQESTQINNIKRDLFTIWANVCLQKSFYMKFL